MAGEIEASVRRRARRAPALAACSPGWAITISSPTAVDDDARDDREVEVGVGVAREAAPVVGSLEAPGRDLGDVAEVEPPEGRAAEEGHAIAAREAGRSERRRPSRR